MTQVESKADSALLQEFLHERDVACPRCEYNLRNLVGTRCPECGDELVLRVNLSEPKMGAFLTGLVGLAAGAGFSGLLVVYMLIMMVVMRGRIGGAIDRFIITTGGGLMVLGAAMVVWLRGRYYIRRQPYSRQWVLAIGCWALTLADLIVFIKMIR